MTFNKVSSLLITASFLIPVAAFATDGYFQPGYSVKSVGMGGVGIAYPQDSLAAASNPAGMGMVKNRFDGGLSIFRPNRDTTIGGTKFDGNTIGNFYVPEAGINFMLRPEVSIGMSMFGNGGMNTGYRTIAASHTGLANGTGVDLTQMFICPSLTYRIGSRNFIGVSLNYVHQSFKATGLGAFANYSSNSSNLTDNGYDSSNGIGFRVGWLGEITHGISLGATYQPKTHMGKFNKYSGLFAGQGSFDIPSNFGAGIAWTPNQKFTFAADVERILYDEVKSLGNTNASFGPGSLGTANGPGFGWQDITAEKVGFAYTPRPELTLRAGWNHSDNPIPQSQVFLNTVSPGIITDHLTFGATYALSKSIELSGDYVHAFQNSVTGPLSPPPYGPGGNETISMYQNTVGISIGWKF